MAKLSAHGHEIGRVYYIASTLAYMSDGHVLRNAGNGWKQYRKVKAGITPEIAFASRKAQQEEFLAAHPAYAAFSKAVQKSAGLAVRWKLVAAIELMPSDPDGVWSEACDGYVDNVSLAVEEIAELCTLYRAVVAERARMQQERVQVPA